MKRWLLSLLILSACSPLAGGEHDSKFGQSFHPDSPPDTTGPVISYSPSSAHVTSIPGSINVGFGEPAYGVELADFQLSGSKCAATLSSVSHTDGATSATLTLGGTLTRFGESCTLQVTGKIKDAAGNDISQNPTITYTYDSVTDANVQINAYTAVSDATVNAGATTFNVADASSFFAGDQIVLIQMQDNATPANAGQYEFATISSISGNQLTVSTGLTNAYTSGTFNATNAKVTQVIRAPAVEQFSLNAGSVTAPAWNGTTGGVVVIDATSSAAIAGTISLSGKGFRGGTTSANLACGVMPTVSATQGESHQGKGSTSTAANLSAGGAGNSGQCGFGGYFGAAGGGGAGHAAAGQDRSASNSAPQVVQGTFGASAGVNTLAKILLGSGGGAGGAHDVGTAGAGGAGGGLVIVRAPTVTVTGAINVSAADGTDCVSPAGAGGGGAGGSALIVASTSATLGTNLITAVAGSGGPAADGQANPSIRQGGNGAAGRIRVNSPSITGTTNPAYF